MLAKRLIPCLDVKDGQVVKGVKFKNHQVLGEIVPMAAQYAAQGADELVFYDITASCEQRTVAADWVSQVAREIDIPFCVAGGVDCVDKARALLAAGADKISVNTPALQNPELINQLASEFGRQCVVVGVDSLAKEGDYYVYQFTGDPDKTVQSNWKTRDWLREVQQRGAGEIVLNCINQDGVRCGYDLAQIRALSEVINVPLIASGGAGAIDHFGAVLAEEKVTGALAASVFHQGEIAIAELKSFLIAQNIEVRR